MYPVRLYLLHFANIFKFYDTCIDKKLELASRVPGCARLRNKFLLSVLWWMAVIIEPFLSFVLITIYLPQYLYRVVIRDGREEIGKHIGLCFAGLARQRIKAVEDVYKQVDYYLYPISMDEGLIMPGKARHIVLEQVSWIEVCKAYLWSAVAIPAAFIKTRGRYLFRNYLCFEYLLTYYFFKRVPVDSTLYFVNHLDRWAVLFNLAPQKKKVLLQHGIETPEADWPVKLTNVNKAYVFSEGQKERMVKAVLGHEPEFAIMPPTIKLTNMPSAKETSIVLVAGPNYMFYDSEEYIIKALAQSEVTIFVKIHPGKNDYSNYLHLKKTDNPNVEIITTATFPRVDIAVSYYSTLGIEYEAYQIPVYYYGEMSLEEIVNEIKLFSVHLE